MKKLKLLLAGFLLLTSLKSAAQLPYTLSTLNQAYQPLTATTTLNGSTIWDDDSISVSMPFAFSVGGRTMTRFIIDLGAGGFFNGDTGVVSGFYYGDMDLVDKGNLTGTATVSPLRYQVAGSTPNRIFKVEIVNAGFYDELNDSNSANDGVNIQMWLYETTNIVELRYGPSVISGPDYFYSGTGPLVGFEQYGEDSSGITNVFYTLTGNPSAPTIDSLDINNGTGNVLNSFPANGTVYRFTPKVANAIGKIPAIANVTVYPTQAQDELHITMGGSATATYRIVGVDGRSTGLTGAANAGTNKVDLRSLAQGMYLLQLENGAGQSTYRFSKK